MFGEISLTRSTMNYIFQNILNRIKKRSNLSHLWVPQLESDPKHRQDLGYLE